MSEKTKKDGRGARGKYQKWLEPENLILIQGWRRDGLSDKQVARNIGINQATLYDWLKKYDKFAEAYKKGTETSTYEVENALYKAACGYDATEAETILTTSPDGLETKQVRKKLRHIPPNVGAICFILKNRRPEKWQDRRDVKLDAAAFKEIPKLYEALGAVKENDVQSFESETGENI